MHRLRNSVLRLGRQFSLSQLGTQAKGQPDTLDFALYTTLNGAQAPPPPSLLPNMMVFALSPNLPQFLQFPPLSLRFTAFSAFSPLFPHNICNFPQFRTICANSCKFSQLPAISAVSCNFPAISRNFCNLLQFPPQFTAISTFFCNVSQFQFPQFVQFLQFPPISTQFPQRPRTSISPPPPLQPDIGAGAVSGPAGKIISPWHDIPFRSADGTFRCRPAPTQPLLSCLPAEVQAHRPVLHWTDLQQILPPSHTPHHPIGQVQ